ncbi:MAG: type II secretion system F family protein [Candidatus Pacebacteria bacterium]|nr:type II secretion system F family protein [Candidatus Paceibacterota bacterium]
MNKYQQKFIDLLKQIWDKIPTGGFSTREQTFFIKRLSFLIKAGVPVLESLLMIEEQTLKKKHSIILKTIIADVSEGQYLSKSMTKFTNVFGDFSINIIAFGESTGMLSENLEYLAEELKKKNTLRKKIIGAFIYPIIITIATFGITAFLMIYLFPKIMPIFSSLHIDLPLSTRIVIFLSQFLREYYVFLILGLITLAISLIVAIKKKPTCRFYFDKLLLKIPLIGKVIQHYNLANYTRTMGLLLKSGVTVSEALEITTKITGNTVYKNELEKMIDFINRGENMSTCMNTNREIFPEILTQIVSVGERSGNLSKSLLYLSELYEGEIDDFTKNLSTTIEPVLMIIMGLLVGFIAISIITPIYSITQNLTPK